MACSWFLVYPYTTANWSYFVADISLGLERSRAFDVGHGGMLFPWEMVSSLLNDLRDMDWVNPCFLPEGEKLVKGVYEKYNLNPENKR